MKKKYKLTGFARLFLFLLFFTPVAYVGASYINGEDGIAKIKSFFEGGIASNESVESQIQKKEAEIKRLEQKIETLRRDVQRLEASK